MLEELSTELKKRGAQMIRTLDISALPRENRRGLDYAIIYSIPLQECNWPAFHRAEMEGELLAKWLVQELISHGYEAFPHTLENVYDRNALRSPLPNKTLAVLAGLGWVGKNALFTSKEYGSAASLAAVLTNAVLPAQNMPPLASPCEDCTVCRDICAPGALQGLLWSPGIPREQLLDAHKCTQCFLCLSQCPWTQRYHERCRPEKAATDYV